MEDRDRSEWERGIEAAIGVLEEIVEDRSRLAALDPETRRRLLEAAGRVSRPERAAMRAMAKALRRRDREDARRADQQVLEGTGIRSLRRAGGLMTPKVLPASEPPHSERPELREARKCYVCKAPFTEVHAFYDQLCGACAELNWRKRHQSADLSGRVALITGARVKIGYHAAIKLLRAGAKVIVTTRFPRDAALRFAMQEDAATFSDRLEIHGLDLRHTPSVEAFCARMLATQERLDYLINNACQTVRRPSGFYQHLIEAEHSGLEALPASARTMLASWEAHREERHGSLARGLDASRDAGLIDPAALSQLALLPEDRGRDLRLFPEGELDADLQQVDRREQNSWRMTLAEVPSVELLEVHLVNAIAPFVLNARLKPLMLRVTTRDAHIVNVSAMEGQFYRDHKTDKHPHTNMAKAALNMMTRTSAIDYVRDGIHMTSVDTGWITDEDPIEIAARKLEEHGFHPPLDAVDGAARIVDPIFHGRITGEMHWGVFLKDYRPIPW